MTRAVTTSGPINFNCGCSSGDLESRRGMAARSLFPRPPHRNRRGALHQKSPQPSLQFAQILEFALPDGQRAPAQFAQLFGVGLIASAVSGDLCAPIIGVRFWRSRAARAIMAVPKTAMHENRAPLADVGDIGVPRQILAVQPIGRRETPQQRANDQFGSRVAGFHRPHGGGAFCRIFGAHAAARSLAPRSKGSSKCAAMCRTAGTTRPSPVK